eukprot:Skav204036  [mRNA]  locus=scaffold1162:107087:109966:+ [translate_table: standard]
MYGLSAAFMPLRPSDAQHLDLSMVDCVLLGMRHPQYVIGTVPLLFATPPVDSEVAKKTLRAVHNTVCMWFATAIHEADHGTSKHWRLPVNEKYSAAQ